MTRDLSERGTHSTSGGVDEHSLVGAKPAEGVDQQRCTDQRARSGCSIAEANLRRVARPRGGYQQQQPQTAHLRR